MLINYQTKPLTIQPTTQSSKETTNDVRPPLNPASQHINCCFSQFIIQPSIQPITNYLLLHPSIKPDFYMSIYLANHTTNPITTYI